MEGASLKRLSAMFFVMLVLAISTISEVQSSNSSWIEHPAPAPAPESEQPPFLTPTEDDVDSSIIDLSGEMTSPSETEEGDVLDISPFADASAADESEHISSLTETPEEDVLDIGPIRDASSAEDISSFVESEQGNENEESLMLRTFPRITRTRFRGCGRRCFHKCFRYLKSNVPAKIRLCQKTCHHRCEFYYRRLKCKVHCVKAVPHAYRHDKKNTKRFVHKCQKKCMRRGH